MADNNTTTTQETEKRITSIDNNLIDDKHFVQICNDEGEDQNVSVDSVVNSLHERSKLFEVGGLLDGTRQLSSSQESSQLAWKNVAIKALIRSFAVRPCLWNNKSEIFMDRELKIEAFEEVDNIMMTFGLTRSGYRKKWAILRGQFFRELARERKSSRRFLSHWKWYKEMSFLTECAEQIDPLTDDKMSTDDNSIETFTASMVEPHQSSIVPSHTIIQRVPIQQQHPGPITIQSVSSLVTPNHPPNRMPQTRSPVSPPPVSYSIPRYPRVVPMVTPTIERQPTTSSYQPSSVLDENNITNLYHQEEEAIFGLMVTKTLQRMTPMQRALAKKRIGDVLYEVEVGGQEH